MLPKKINIANVPVVISQDRRLLEKENGNDAHSKAIGYTFSESQQILIDPDLGEEIKISTLLHEVMHYIIYLNGGREIFSHQMEEKFIGTLCHTLFDTIRNNPSFAKCLVTKG